MVICGEPSHLRNFQLPLNLDFGTGCVIWRLFTLISFCPLRCCITHTVRVSFNTFSHLRKRHLVLLLLLLLLHFCFDRRFVEFCLSQRHSHFHFHWRAVVGGIPLCRRVVVARVVPIIWLTRVRRLLHWGFVPFPDSLEGLWKWLGICCTSRTEYASISYKFATIATRPIHWLGLRIPFVCLLGVFWMSGLEGSMKIEATDRVTSHFSRICSGYDAYLIIRALYCSYCYVKSQWQLAHSRTTQPQ